MQFDFFIFLAYHEKNRHAKHRQIEAGMAMPVNERPYFVFKSSSEQINSISRRMEQMYSRLLTGERLLFSDDGSKRMDNLQSIQFDKAILLKALDSGLLDISLGRSGLNAYKKSVGDIIHDTPNGREIFKDIVELFARAQENELDKDFWF